MSPVSLVDVNMFVASRVQEKCQPRDDAGDDEGGYVMIDRIDRKDCRREGRVVGVGNRLNTDAWFL